jgi:hypothetical protein
LELAKKLQNDRHVKAVRRTTAKLSLGELQRVLSRQLQQPVLDVQRTEMQSPSTSPAHRKKIESLSM